MAHALNGGPKSARNALMRKKKQRTAAVSLVSLQVNAQLLASQRMEPKFCSSACFVLASDSQDFNSVQENRCDFGDRSGQDVPDLTAF